LKEYRVNIKPTAEKDLEQRYLQIAEDSPENAVNWYLGLVEAIEKLDVMAERCPIAPEDADFQLGIRHLIVGNYRVLYRINGQQVDVLHIRHSAHARVL
jgi:plasmid stabilization system protein ParE